MFCVVLNGGFIGFGFLSGWNGLIGRILRIPMIATTDSD